MKNLYYRFVDWFFDVPISEVEEGFSPSIFARVAIVYVSVGICHFLVVYLLRLLTVLFS